jgi:cell division septum initiation protein DivIVA
LERVHQELEQMSAADRVEVSRLREKIEEQLAKLQQMPQLVHSFFGAPSVAHISD